MLKSMQEIFIQLLNYIKVCSNNLFLVRIKIKSSNRIREIKKAISYDGFELCFWYSVLSQ